MTLLITALIGNVIDEAFSGNSSSINYAMFVAVFSWVVVLYGLAAAVMESIAIPIAMMVLNGLAVMFTFIAGVVLAAKLGVHSCGNSVRFASPMQKSKILTNSPTGLYQFQFPNQWLPRHFQALPRATGQLCLLLVPLRRLHRLALLLIHWHEELRHQLPRRWNAKRWAFHVPRLRNGEQLYATPCLVCPPFRGHLS